jgi:acetyl esterase
VRHGRATMIAMPLDPVLAQILQQLDAAGVPPIGQSSPQELREQFAAIAFLAGEGARVASVVDREVGGVRSLVYTPEGEGPFPVLVWIHGGGFVIGNPEMYDQLCRDLAATTPCIVVSLDYRLAPEHKAPAAVDDAFAAVGWVLDHADEIGGDRDRVAVGGDSAGGNLSALAAQHFGSRLVFQLLVYPSTDLTASSPSIDENAEGYLLTKEGMIWFGEHYLEDSVVEPTDPRVSPIHASDEAVAAVAPAYVITAEFDPLRDEGEAYAERMRGLGVDVTADRFDGMIHGFYSMAALVPAAQVAIRRSVEHLAAAFRA